SSGNADAMAQEMGNSCLVLTVTSKFWPIAGNRLIVGELATLVQHVHSQCGQSFGRRIQDEHRLRGHWFVIAGAGETTADIQHPLAAPEYGKLRAPEQLSGFNLRAKQGTEFVERFPVHAHFLWSNFRLTLIKRHGTLLV